MKLSHLFLTIILAVASGPAIAVDMIRLTAAYSNNALSSDPSVVYYESQSTENFDGAYDALKFFNTDPNVTNFYIIGKDNSKLSINAIPFNGSEANCKLRLGLITNKEGMVRFSIKDIAGSYQQQPVFLTDEIKGTTWNLSLDGDFFVELPAGQYEDRFYLSLGTVMTGIKENALTENSMTAFASNGALNVDLSLPMTDKGILTVYSLSGFPIANCKVNESGRYEFRLSESAFYIVTLKYGNHRISRKVFYNS